MSNEAWVVDVALLQRFCHDHLRTLPPDLWVFVGGLEAICIRLLVAADQDVPVSGNQAGVLSQKARELIARLTDLDGVKDDAFLAKRMPSIPTYIDDFRLGAMHVLFDDLVRLPDALATEVHALAARVTAVESRPPDELRAEADKLRAEMQAIVNEAKEQQATARTTMTAALAEAGVGKFAEHFAGLATTHKVEAQEWLGRTGWLASVTFIGALIFLINVIANTWELEPIAGVAAAALLSILASATVFCARNYRAHQHNDAVNQHRAVALQTFAAFRDSTTDQPTKDAILALAAQCAFTGQDTGFGGAVEVVTPVVQALKAKP